MNVRAAFLVLAILAFAATGYAQEHTSGYPAARMLPDGNYELTIEEPLIAEALTIRFDKYQFEPMYRFENTATQSVYLVGQGMKHNDGMRMSFAFELVKGILEDGSIQLFIPADKGVVLICAPLSECAGCEVALGDESATEACTPCEGDDAHCDQTYTYIRQEGPFIEMIKGQAELKEFTPAQ